MKQDNKSKKQLDLDFGVKKYKQAANSDIKFFLGFTIYIIIFGISIPFYLYKYHHHIILEAYMPNLDLIANIPRGWSIAFVMLLATYLLPGRIISHMMEKCYKFIQNHTLPMSIIPYSFTILIGSLFTILIIGMEYLFLRYYKKDLGNFAIKLTKIIKDILK